MKRALLLLVAAVVIAGCTAPGQQQPEEEPKVISISGPDCQVGGGTCAETTITRFGGPAEVRLEVQNFGDEPISIDVGANGRNIMVSKCNDEIATLDSDIGGFSGRVEGPSRFDQYPDDAAFPERVTLDGDERLVMVWTLDIPTDVDVSQLGYSCPMDFEMTFNQTIRSGQQIQLKADDEVPDASSLDSMTTAEEPVRLVIDAPDSFVVDQGTLVVQSFLRNGGSGEITDIQRIERDPDSPGVLAGASCRPANDELRMYGSGERQGESYRKSCTIPSSAIDLTGRSDVQWARYIAEYTYQLPLGSETIQMRPTEGGR